MKLFLILFSIFFISSVSKGEIIPGPDGAVAQFPFGFTADSAIANANTRGLQILDTPVRKILNANDSTGPSSSKELTDLTFTGLEQGATYEYQAVIQGNIAGARQCYIGIVAGDGSEQFGERWQQDLSLHTTGAPFTNYRYSASLAGRFVADATGSLRTYIITSISSGTCEVEGPTTTNGQGYGPVGGGTATAQSWVTLWKVANAP